MARKVLDNPLGLLILMSIIAFSSLRPAWVMAQQLSDDFVLPVIGDEQIDPDNSLLFRVPVTDNIGLKSVYLHYRFSGDSAFSNTLMSAKPGSTMYSVDLIRDHTGQSSIDYYFQAIDVTDNEILKGFSFNPLTRSINHPVNTASPIQAQQERDTTVKVKSKTLYYLLGLAAIGTLAALAGGGDDGGGDASTCIANGCDINLSLTQP